MGMSLSTKPFSNTAWMNGHIAQCDDLYITGLAGQYPQHILEPEDFEEYLGKVCADDLDSKGIRKLLALSRATGIEKRATIGISEDPLFNRPAAPLIDELSRMFRKSGVDLTVQACKQALFESGLSALDITHIVGVTCTDAGNPGFDLLVAQKLGVRDDAERTLLHGVGCAGGLAALRTAANLACSATFRQRHAHVLVFACELCSIHVRCELHYAVTDPDDVRIAPALFSDGAAALVLSNRFVPEAESRAIFTLLDWGSAVIPDSLHCMAFEPDPLGFKVTLTKEVPEKAIRAIVPMWEQLRRSFTRGQPAGRFENVDATNCDWALHPGGMAILKGAQQILQLSDDHLRASLDIYKSHGNSSSPTVLIVLDRLRQMGHGRHNVVATSFGPGLCIEMVTMKRSRKDANSSTM